MFEIPSGTKKYEFRRGTYPATIYSLAFDKDSRLLSVSSDSDTIHIFKLEPHGSSLIGSVVGESWDASRAFARLHLPSARLPSLCVSSMKGQVLVVTADGYFHVYSLDVEKGGECKLLRRHRYLIIL